jgi:hypothetical protein
VAWLIFTYKVPPALLLNLDQFGQKLLSIFNRTRVTKGQKTVGVLGAEDKRQITGVGAVSARGDFLGIQAIWQGKTSRCHPKGVPSHPNLIHTQSINHWSTLATMKDLLDRLIRPYIIRVIAELNLPADQVSILMVDMWKVHITKEFRDYVSQMRPRIELNYIEAGTTPKAQRAFSHSPTLTFITIKSPFLSDGCFGQLRDQIH